MELTREQILEGKYIFPKRLVALKPTRHFYKRLEERGLALDCIPTLVRVTENNIQSGKTENGRVLCSVVVKLYYKQNKSLYLCFNPYDGALKTLWFRGKRDEDRRRKRGTTSDR